MEIIFHSDANKTHFHKKGCAPSLILKVTVFGTRGVYMRKLAPARVSYRHDFLISYRVYMMTGLFHISLFEGTLHIDKMHV